jgi:hypothetical protein
VADLVAALLFVAEDLDRRGYALAGAVRQGARRVAELEALTPGPDGCKRCGKPLDQKPTGRPRQWCSERCRRKVLQTKTLREA